MSKILLEDIRYILDKTPSLEKFKDCTVLVTGASGLIGSMAARTLMQASADRNLNIRLIALVRNVAKAQQILKGPKGWEPEFICGDVREQICFPEKLDYIIHCASVTQSREMVEHPAETFWTSVMGTKNILELAREKAVKSMVFLSSMEIYGTDVPTVNGRVTEDMLGSLDLAHPRSAYPEGKRAAECLCCAYHSEHGVPVKIARLAQTFGAGAMQEDNRVFAQFAGSAVRGTDIILHTDGKSEGNYCYLADAVYGILTILLHGENGEAYNVANEELHMTIGQMAETVAAQVAGGKIKVTWDIQGDIMKFGYAPAAKLCLSAEKLRKLGWSPHYNMTDMYRRMIAYWKEKDELIPKMKGN